MTASQELIAARYRLVRSLGTGGMGRVWLARDEVLRREVAMKEVLLPEHLTGSERDELKARTLREARAAARLSHPNVVQIYDVVRGQDPPWIVMEYVQAVSLHQLIKERGPVTPQRAAQIGLAMLGALRAAHRNGVLHRDVKPSNVLIAEDGRVVLTDFGLATIEGTEGAVTRPGLILGSPQYVAPERARDGVSTPETDLWSLGATLYAAVEGRSPYARSSAMATLTALATRPPDPSQRAGPLKPVLHGLLRKNPRTRLTAEALEPMLRRVAGGDGGPRPRLLLTRPRPRDEAGASPVSGGPVSGRPSAGPPDRGVDRHPNRPLDRHSYGGAKRPSAALPPIPEFPPLVGRIPVAVPGGGAGVEGGATDAAPEASSVDRAGSLTVVPSPVPMNPPHRPGDDDLGDDGPPPPIGRSTSVRVLRAVLLVLAGLLLIPALIATLLVAGAFEQRDGDGGTGPRVTPTTGATAGLFAPPPTAVVSNQATVPKGWVLYNDPTGYQIGVPDRWRYSVEDGWVFFREPNGERVLCLDVLETAPPANPLAATRQREKERAASGALPGYRLVAMEPSALGDGGVLWEYTYAGPDGPVHETELLLSSGGKGFRIRWSTPEFDWGTSRQIYFVITSSFKPAG